MMQATRYTETQQDQPVVQEPQDREPQDAAAFEARISAWVDGQDDIRPEDVATPYGRRLWDTYHLIGDVMRSDSLAVRPGPLFYARLSKALDAEPPIVASGRWRLLRPALSGLAVLAVVVWMVQPYFTQTGGDSAPVLANVGDDGALRDYLDAHGAMTGAGAIRRVSFGGARP